MEIDFNAKPIRKPESAEPVVRPDPVPPVEGNAAFKKIDALEAQLKALPQIRPEKVEEARALIANVQYPPEQVLKSLATLLALELK
ncbi:MAG TPA: hypothetical protein VFW05_14095 [Verrucomicrobiae bacterium]|nr:hypothetical protein [Verrucomicrobiae bacterium]